MHVLANLSWYLPSLPAGLSWYLPHLPGALTATPLAALPVTGVGLALRLLRRR